MQIKTFQFGTIDFDPGRIINFPQGIFGFENLKSFLLIKDDDNLFYWLNSVEQPDIAFPVIGTRIIDEDYPAENDYEAFTIVTLNNDPLKITANLKAPVYISQNKKNGFQKVIDSEKYPVNFRLFIDVNNYAGERE